MTTSLNPKARRPRVSLQVLETLLSAVALAEELWAHEEDYASYGPVGLPHKEALRRTSLAKAYVMRLIIWLKCNK